MANKKAIYRKKPKDSSDIVLDMALRYFEHEYDRSKKIEGKASIFIGSIGVMFTLLAGYIDMDLNKVPKYTRDISIVLFVLCAIVYFIAVYNYIKVFKVQEYNVLNYESYFTQNMIDSYSDEEMKKALAIKYNKLLKIIKNGNDHKADYYEIGLKSTLIGFALSFILMFINFIN